MHQEPAAKKNPVFLTGIPGIDIQHDELFFMCNAQLDALGKKNPDLNAVIISLNDILVFLRSHCSTEESLLKMIDFPKVAEHKTQHRNLCSQFAKGIKELQNSEGSEISRYIRSFMNALRAHISVFDRDYKAHVDKIIALRKKFNISALKARVLAG